jgi:anti-sigma28 factor (negative regulator of flagellin synthesis)
MTCKSPPDKPQLKSCKRKKKLENIRKKVLSGQYTVNADEIAKALVSR